MPAIGLKDVLISQLSLLSRVLVIAGFSGVVAAPGHLMLLTKLKEEKVTASYATAPQQEQHHRQAMKLCQEVV